MRKGLTAGFGSLFLVIAATETALAGSVGARQATASAVRGGFVTRQMTGPGFVHRSDLARGIPINPRPQANLDHHLNHRFDHRFDRFEHRWRYPRVINVIGGVGVVGGSVYGPDCEMGSRLVWNGAEWVTIC
jgi:hypothetical protein